MAKKSKIVKNHRRSEIVARYAERRAELKGIIRSPQSTFEQRLDAQRALARQPRDASPVRLRNRDAVDGNRVSPKSTLARRSLAFYRVSVDLDEARRTRWRRPSRRPQSFSR